MAVAYCAICGAPLSEKNTTGIGYECRQILDKLKREKLFSLKEKKQAFYAIATKNYVAFAESKRELFKGKESKLVSSLLAWYEDKGFLTYKQNTMLVDIVKRHFMGKLDYLQELEKKIKKEEQFFISSNSQDIEISIREIEIERQRMRKAKREGV